MVVVAVSAVQSMVVVAESAVQSMVVVAESAVQSMVVVAESAVQSMVVVAVSAVQSMVVVAESAVQSMVVVAESAVQSMVVVAESAVQSMVVVAVSAVQSMVVVAESAVQSMVVVAESAVQSMVVVAESAVQSMVVVAESAVQSMVVVAESAVQSMVVVAVSAVQSMVVVAVQSMVVVAESAVQSMVVVAVSAVQSMVVVAESAVQSMVVVAEMVLGHAGGEEKHDGSGNRSGGVAIHHQGQHDGRMDMAGHMGKAAHNVRDADDDVAYDEGRKLLLDDRGKGRAKGGGQERIAEGRAEGRSAGRDGERGEEGGERGGGGVKEMFVKECPKQHGGVEEARGGLGGMEEGMVQLQQRLRSAEAKAEEVLLVKQEGSADGNKRVAQWTGEVKLGGGGGGGEGRSAVQCAQGGCHSSAQFPFAPPALHLSCPLSFLRPSPSPSPCPPIQPQLVDLDRQHNASSQAVTALVDLDRQRNAGREAITALKKHARGAAARRAGGRREAGSGGGAAGGGVSAEAHRPLVTPLPAVPVGTSGLDGSSECAVCGAVGQKERVWVAMGGGEMFVRLTLHHAHVHVKRGIDPLFPLCVPHCPVLPAVDRIDVQMEEGREKQKAAVRQLTEEGGLAGRVGEGIVHALTTLKDAGK
ncbi:unnamed protein product [Closterium sp. NIES-64]|nr:unnamed protein product [Closterium sp. NIES-64]